jgi:hypothetical protein
MRVRLRLALIVAALGTGLVVAQAQQPDASRDDRILPGRLGLPATNTRSSEPFVTRIYKTDDIDQILKKQPKSYPFTITEDYELGDNEKAQVHKGVDITSRPAPNQPARPMDFKAGVYGLVVRAGGGDWGTISVQLPASMGEHPLVQPMCPALCRSEGVRQRVKSIGIRGRCHVLRGRHQHQDGLASTNRIHWYRKWHCPYHRCQSRLGRRQ